ncbi:MAG: hypothetical protein JO055_16910 [Alphaproteobacteria bacterium]|nr:hypothetical protein [Alphaproteobacteria bacterium]
MSRIGRTGPVALALLAATIFPSFAQNASPQVAARGDAVDSTPVRLLCTPKALGLVCSATNVRAAVTAGQGGRSQTLTLAPYQPFATPRGRTLTGFDVTVTAYVSRSDGGRVLLIADVGGDARSLDLSDQVTPGRGGIRTIHFATDAGWISETFEDGAAVRRLPMHLMLTAQTRTAADTARLDLIEVELRPLFHD